MSVNLLKDSPRQKLAYLESQLDNLQREIRVRENASIYKLIGGGSIDYRKPGSDKPAPGEIASKLGDFIEANR